MRHASGSSTPDDSKNKHADKNWAPTTYSSAIENKSDYRPKLLEVDVHTDHKVQINYKLALRAKNIIVDNLNGTDIESFQKLPNYIQAINESNPGSHTILNVIAEKFYSLFVSYASSIEGIKHCRPLTALDGTHLMSKYQGILLIAVGVDADNHFFPLAFGVVKAEIVRIGSGSWNMFALAWEKTLISTL
ncbi:hypothetical protein V1507DRAFT_436515 [Lipomyces tetrasporus]